MKRQLTAERLRELLSYDPETGVFVWCVRRRGVRLGMRAGTVNGRGYRQICIDGTIHLEHRLAWLYVHGEWPVEIDHRDLSTANNAIANLRLATRVQNNGNKRAHRTSRTGVKGVSQLPSGRFKAVIRTKYIGAFETTEAASVAYMAEAAKVFGEFARAA